MIAQNNWIPYSQGFALLFDQAIPIKHWSILKQEDKCHLCGLDLDDDEWVFEFDDNQWLLHVAVLCKLSWRLGDTGLFLDFSFSYFQGMNFFFWS